MGTFLDRLDKGFVTGSNHPLLFTFSCQGAIHSNFRFLFQRFVIIGDKYFHHIQSAIWQFGLAIAAILILWQQAHVSTTASGIRLFPSAHPSSKRTRGNAFIIQTTTSKPGNNDCITAIGFRKIAWAGAGK